MKGYAQLGRVNGFTFRGYGIFEQFNDEHGSENGNQDHFDILREEYENIYQIIKESKRPLFFASGATSQTVNGATSAKLVLLFKLEYALDVESRPSFRGVVVAHSIEEITEQDISFMLTSSVKEITYNINKMSISEDNYDGSLLYRYDLAREKLFAVNDFNVSASLFSVFQKMKQKFSYISDIVVLSRHRFSKELADKGVQIFDFEEYKDNFLKKESDIVQLNGASVEHKYRNESETLNMLMSICETLNTIREENNILYKIIKKSNSIAEEANKRTSEIERKIDQFIEKSATQNIQRNREDIKSNVNDIIQNNSQKSVRRKNKAGKKPSFLERISHFYSNIGKIQLINPSSITILSVTIVTIIVIVVITMVALEDNSGKSFSNFFTPDRSEGSGNPTISLSRQRLAPGTFPATSTDDSGVAVGRGIPNVSDVFQTGTGIDDAGITKIEPSNPPAPPAEKPQ